jgi:DNA-directed RNA polymerase specialized sigma24 family protein
MDTDIHLDGILVRDKQAFARWMSVCEEPMRVSLRSFASVVDVEAVLQESLLRVWTVAPRFVRDGKPNGLLRLGVRIARNLAVSELRRTRSRPMSPEDLEDRADVEEPAAPDPLLRQTIAECRESLPGKPRQALDARLASNGREEDLDLAATLGMTLNTFLQNFTRARRFLAECLKKHGVDIDPELST